MFPFQLERGRIGAKSQNAGCRLFPGCVALFKDAFDLFKRFSSVLPKSNIDEERYGFRCVIVKHGWSMKG